MFSTDPVPTRDATNEDAGLFVRAASSGYLEGMQALLKAGFRFSHDDWVSALEDAAHGGHKSVVQFVVRQLAAQKSDVLIGNEWLDRIRRAHPMMADLIEAGENYVRACKVRDKLQLRGIFAGEVEAPDFIKTEEKSAIYEFCKDRESAIVGDHSARRRHRAEGSTVDQASDTDGAWVPAGGDFGPIGSEQARAG
jgi:hypothetical protein